jgi:hypothetical protein
VVKATFGDGGDICKLRPLQIHQVHVLPIVTPIAQQLNVRVLYPDLVLIVPSYYMLPFSNHQLFLLSLSLCFLVTHLHN